MSAPVPTVNVTINKSRIKLYNQKNSIPMYYLKKDTEFELELFNPTCDTILAKIYLNDKMISQGGLVLRPGERVFLDRYFDVPNKFKFDTYNVANTEAVKQAIQDNGDIKVQFYREQQILPIFNTYHGTLTIGNNYYNSYRTSFPTSGDNEKHLFRSNNLTGSGHINGITNTCYAGNSAGANTTTYNASLDMMPLCDTELLSDTEPRKRCRAAKLSKQSIETGRIEVGSQSNQKFQTVSKVFESFAFHTVDYKLLPISQKVNTVENMKIKIYCTSCGNKLKETYKFCPICSAKV